MLPGCTTGLVDPDRLYIGICPVTYRDSWIPTLPGCVTGHNEYRVNQPWQDTLT